MNNELIKALNYLCDNWLYVFNYIYDKSQDESLAAHCADSVIHEFMWSATEQAKDNDSQDTNKLINPDGTLNLKEWLKGGDK